MHKGLLLLIWQQTFFAFGVGTNNLHMRVLNLATCPTWFSSIFRGASGAFPARTGLASLRRSAPPCQTLSARRPLMESWCPLRFSAVPTKMRRPTAPFAGFTVYLAAVALMHNWPRIRHWRNYRAKPPGPGMTSGLSVIEATVRHRYADHCKA